MKNFEIQTLYKLLFTDYPDIVTVRQLQVMLGISRHAAYDLLTDGSIRGLKLGNAYKRYQRRGFAAAYRSGRHTSCGNRRRTQIRHFENRTNDHHAISDKEKL